MPAWRNRGSSTSATKTSAMAAIHSKAAMASPVWNPSPDMPMKCSEEMFDAISETPMSHQGRLRPARK